MFSVGQIETQASARLHPESLLRIPLISQMFFDSQVRKLERAVDQSWSYHHFIPGPISGFNPFSGAIYYSQNSVFSEWLSDPYSSARPLNEKDYLVRETFYAVHDYLHVWAYYLIHDSIPRLGFPVAPITRKNIEDFVFCHILSEAVATVGLDYWYLASVQLNQTCDIGTRFKLLTTSYHDEAIGEFARFNPEFNPQSRGFFVDFAEFYCTGVLKGFDDEALTQSAQVGTWLEHELSYGEKQREYVRLWFSYLSRDEISYPATQLSAPISVAERWKRDLIRLVSEKLWDKVKNDKRESFARVFDPSEVWRSDLSKKLDFRFLNAGSPLVERLLRRSTPENFEYYFFQRLASCEFKLFPPELRAKIPVLLQRKSVATAEKFFDLAKKCERNSNEPVDLFFMA